MCVCAYPYKHTNTCIHARIVHACVRADIHEHQHTYMHKHTNTHTHTHNTHNMHTRIHACTHTYIHTCLHKHTYTRARARTHTHTHRRTQPLRTRAHTHTHPPATRCPPSSTHRIDLDVANDNSPSTHSRLIACHSRRAARTLKTSTLSATTRVPWRTSPHASATYAMNQVNTQVHETAKQTRLSHQHTQAS